MDADNAWLMLPMCDDVYFDLPLVNGTIDAYGGVLFNIGDGMFTERMFMRYSAACYMGE